MAYLSCLLTERDIPLQHGTTGELTVIYVQKNTTFPKVEYLLKDAIRVLLRETVVATRLGLRDRMMLIFFYDIDARIQEVLNVALVK